MQLLRKTSSLLLWFAITLLFNVMPRAVEIYGVIYKNTHVTK
jgi:hypothetical protein